MVTRHYLVSGVVQGVGFRYVARDEAVRLNVTGWIRNLQDGRVEAVACGDVEALVVFENWLRHGPDAARVDEVTVTSIEDESFAQFEIRSTAAAPIR